MLPARSVPGILHIQPKIDLVREHLYMTLRLHAAAHDAECFPRFAVFHHEAGNDGVKRTFAWRINVRVSRIHGKKFTASLKHEAEARHYDPAAHPAIIALNQRHHVAFVISRAHVNRVAVVDRGTGAGSPSSRTPCRATRARAGSIIRTARFN